MTWQDGKLTGATAGQVLRSEAFSIVLNAGDLGVIVLCMGGALLSGIGVVIGFKRLRQSVKRSVGFPGVMRSKSR